MLRLLRGAFRGVVAWVAGVCLTYVLLSVGVVSGRDGANGAVLTYLDIHALAVDGRLLLPVLVLAVVGYRVGASLRTGITGRIRTFVQSIRGTERNRLLAAATAASIIAGSYAGVALLAALLVGGPVLPALIRSLVVALLVAVPAAVLGAHGLTVLERLPEL